MVSKENKSSIRHEMSIKGGYGQKCRKTDRKLETDRKKIVHFYGSFGKMCIEKLWCPNIFFFQNKNHNYTPYIMVSNKNSFSKLTKCPERKMWAITKESFFSLSILIHKKVLPTHGLNHSQVQGKKCLKANWIQSITIICTNFSSKTHAHLQHKKSEK